MPPVSTRTPAPAPESSRASAWAPAIVRCWRSTKPSEAAIRRATALAAITCSSGPPCWPGKTAESIFLACSSRAQDHPGAGPAEGLVGGRGDHVGVLDRVGVQPGGDEAGEVRHVDHQQRADLVGDLPEAGEVELAGVRRPARQQQLRPRLAGDAGDLVHVDQAALAVDLVGHHLVQAPGDVQAHAVGEVAPVGQREPHDRVSRARAGRGRRPRWPASPSAAGRWRARRRTGPSRGRSRAARRRRPTRSRRSSAGRDSPRRTCSSAPSPGTRARPAARSSPRRSSRACPAGARARRAGPRRSPDPPPRGGG